MKRVFLLSLCSLVLLCSCTTTTPQTEEKPQNEEKPPVEEKPTDKTPEEIFNENLKTIKKISKGASEANYQMKQTDNYGAIDVEATIEGSIKLYNNNFLKEDIKGFFSDVSNTFNSERQVGIHEYEGKNSIYDLTDFDLDDTNDKINWYLNTEENIARAFDAGYSKVFENSILGPLNQKFDSKYKVRCEHNLSSTLIDITKNDPILLAVNIYVYEGQVEYIKYQHQSEITLKEGKVSSAKVTTLQSMMGGTNYNFLEGVYNFKYEQLTDFNGFKINPIDFMNKLPTTEGKV